MLMILLLFGSYITKCCGHNPTKWETYDESCIEPYCKCGNGSCLVFRCC